MSHFTQLDENEILKKALILAREIRDAIPADLGHQMTGISSEQLRIIRIRAEELEYLSRLGVDDGNIENLHGGSRKKRFLKKRKSKKYYKTRKH